jgi:outer membrane protein assembly factor BamE (lipoprotein component of BamABCDE complex)
MRLPIASWRSAERLTSAIALMLAAAALIVAVIALRSTNKEERTYAGLGAASIAQLHGLMTQEQVRSLLGTPATVYRDNARAQCWAYHSPYDVRMCFGPRRRLAWWASNVPHRPTA